MEPKVYYHVSKCSKVMHLVLKLGHTAKYVEIRNTCEELKCGVGEGRRRQVGLNV